MHTDSFNERWCVQCRQLHYNYELSLLKITTLNGVSRKYCSTYRVCANRVSVTSTTEKVVVALHVQQRKTNAHAFKELCSAVCEYYKYYNHKACYTYVQMHKEKFSI
eukprot:3194-Heterococcus_DN1.PRE.1